LRNGTLVWSDEPATSLRLTEKRYQIYFKENSVWKLFNNLKGHSTVGSKVRVLSNRYSGLVRRDLHFTEYRFHVYFKENSIRKLF
jgi:hypothetical protein